MLASLLADLAVMRNKTEFALNSKSALVDAERRLNDCMKRVETLAEKVIKTREQLCSERLAIVERTTEFECQSERVEHGQQRLQRDTQTSKGLHGPVLECLDLQLGWAQTNAARVRGEKIREIFSLLGLVPSVTSKTNDAPLGAKGPYYRTIAMLPLPLSGRFEVMPAEIVAGALGKVIHLLLLLSKHLKLAYPHPMVYNGSFSTIGNTSEGAGCHTLYPDGSMGFDRGVSMVHENIAYLASTQGVALSKLHGTDILGNLLLVYQSPSLGTVQDSSEAASIARVQRPGSSTKSSLGQSAFLLANSQTLTSSAEILPEYSMVQ